MNIKSLAVGLYGVSVIASGMLRYFGQDGGETGLIFGAIMGLIAIVAAVCFAVDQKVAGHCLAWSTILLVGGWFVYEALVKKGFDVAELRQLVIIALSVLAATVLLVPKKGGAAKGSAKPGSLKGDSLKGDSPKGG